MTRDDQLREDLRILARQRARELPPQGRREWLRHPAFWFALGVVLGRALS